MKSLLKSGTILGGRCFRAILYGACLAMPAIAQDAPEATSGSEEVTVTAQKRSQNIQDVPISITVISGENVEKLGVRQTKDLQNVVPGLTARTTQGDGNPTFTVRGIGLSDFSTNNNPNVSVYVDDVLLPYTSMLAGSLFDIERVEVLKGPQGTLYGRNTTGGAIRFISRRPSSEPQTRLRLDVGDYGLFEGEMATGGPLSEGLSYRISLTGTHRERGWQTIKETNENVGEVNRVGGRIQLLWEPSEAFDILLGVHGGKEYSDNQLFRARSFQNAFGPGNCPAMYLYNDDGNCVTYATGGRVYYNDSEDNRLVSASSYYGNRLDNKTAGVNLVANWNLGGVTLSSITGIDYSSTRNGSDSDGTPFILLDSLWVSMVHSYSQEFRATSADDGPIKWTAGLYLSTDRNYGDIPQALNDRSFGRTIVETTWVQKTDSIALFGQAEWQITDALSLTGGVRLTYEHKSYDYDAYDLDPFGTSSFVAGGTSPVRDYYSTINETDLSWKAGIDYKITRDMFAYATVSRGFKSGGYKAAIQFSVAELAPFEPEILYAYEVGLKTAWFDRELKANAAFYYYDWTDYQATGTTCAPICVTTLTNVGDAEVYGFEGEISWVPSGKLEGLSLTLGTNWLKSEVLSGPYMGKKLAQTPDFSVNGVVRYETPTGYATMLAYGQIAAYYQSSTEFSNQNFLQQHEPGYVALNLRVGVLEEAGNWDFAIWVNNLTDEEYRVSSENRLGFIPVGDVYGAPRTIGASFSVSY